MPDRKRYSHRRPNRTPTTAAAPAIDLSPIRDQVQRMYGALNSETMSDMAAFTEIRCALEDLSEALDRLSGSTEQGAIGN